MNNNNITTQKKKRRRKKLKWPEDRTRRSEREYLLYGSKCSSRRIYRLARRWHNREYYFLSSELIRLMFNAASVCQPEFFPLSIGCVRGLLMFTFSRELHLIVCWRARVFVREFTIQIGYFCRKNHHYGVICRLLAFLRLSLHALFVPVLSFSPIHLVYCLWQCEATPMFSHTQRNKYLIN